MRIAYPFLLTAMLLIVPQLTQAQLAGSTAGGSVVADRSSVHVSIDWAKQRLDEIDATLASLEKRLGDLRLESRATAEHALAVMREQREAFRESIEANKQASEAEWLQAKEALNARWTAFDAAVQRWVDATRGRFAEQNEMFAARTEAQLKAWQEMIDQVEASAKGFASDRKREIDSTLTTIRAGAEATKARLEALRQSGKESWSALDKALTESRDAFDRANHTAYEAFKRATN